MRMLATSTFHRLTCLHCAGDEHRALNRGMHLLNYHGLDLAHARVELRGSENPSLTFLRGNHDTAPTHQTSGLPQCLETYLLTRDRLVLITTIFVKCRSLLVCSAHLRLARSGESEARISAKALFFCCHADGTAFKCRRRAKV